MKICFISLSRKRKRYFTLLANSAPNECEASVIPGIRPNFTLLKSLLHFPKPLGFEDVHARRQVINYPTLNKFKPLSALLLAVNAYAETVRYYYFKSLFMQQQCDYLGVWNGQKPPYSTVAKAAIDCGMQVTYFENGGLPDTTTADNKGVNAWNSLPRNIDFYLQYASDNSNSRVDEEAVEAESVSQPYIFVPLQVESDTQVVLQTTWVKGNIALLEAVAEVFGPYIEKGWKVLVKEHPKARTSSKDFQHKGFEFVGSGDVATYIKDASAVVTINSTVGLEALQMNKNVVVVGNALYGIEGLSFVATNPLTLKSAIDSAVTLPFNLSAKEAFFRFLDEVYYIPGDWRRFDELDEAHFRALWMRILKQDTMAKLANDKAEGSV
ncbi:hypothetical protein [Thiomicrorhabdus xiamenensis]|uniref:Capsular polysaccharide export protein n=1 Tax=Thiomicrorhabdus xiamenensis TaxID=2739063 RepID=A0A7D4P432_9GAMM|nr:hypothetical protein [Thiomicrorhabdus xiamenensis]QKI88635.1 hypothetical protein HQN79_03130 [Thiomicrorhabdus xiamenensis]